MTKISKLIICSKISKPLGGNRHFFSTCAQRNSDALTCFMEGICFLSSVGRGITFAPSYHPPVSGKNIMHREQ